MIAYASVITLPEATNTGPGFNRGSGGGARGVASKNGKGHMRVQRGVISLAHDASICWQGLSVATMPLKLQLAFSNRSQAHKLSHPIFKHAQHTHAAPKTIALSAGRSRC